MAKEPRLVNSGFVVELKSYIAGTYPPQTVTHVELAAGQGVLTDGTLIGVTSAYNDGKPFGSLNNFDSGVQAVFVLAEDIDTEGEEPAVAQVFNSGCFGKQALTLADEYEFTRKDIEEARKQNIRLVDVITGGQEAE